MLPNLDVPDGFSWYGTEDGGKVEIWTYSSKSNGERKRSMFTSRVNEQLMRGGWEKCPGSTSILTDWIRDGVGMRLHFVGGSGYTTYARLTTLPYEMANGCPS
ncbi:hypothetical protein [Mycolicibacter arupensis]|jgi:hypothetical protein|uniref:Uncharacterized protein n=1 Tax=Mycolicibacter arupensis TaxID=342002 RepID=A0A0F5MY67_9MYCO|nr:hypothetical protein [Mycolicibacter arupensis]KAA1429703.1 hypothetical protein F0402_17835 [Mycolicibacter arupensis]KKB98987.1 hypothetical protein WR43_11775 [Mycolicibacter arupensis]MCV7276004.1 hypothetical protein [Mycolicibacter arupensis]OQZ91835.1 hypothetical protein BST15_19535 [Mycolicibacter arupensis]TXI49297.1 MAG: hypothetical protein E6Q54_22655 [Mycolicibacter arupensis]